MRQGVLHRLDSVARNISPFFVTLLLVLATLLPLKVSAFAPIMPAVALVGVFFWSVHRPDLMPIWAVFLIGFVQDLLSGGIWGPGIVGLLVAHALVVWQHRFFLSASFVLIWCVFMLVAAVAMAVTWLCICLAMMTYVDPDPVFFQFLMTVAIYPCLAWIFLRGRRLFQH